MRNRQTLTLRPNRRYRDADLSPSELPSLETPWHEKLRRLLFQPEYLDDYGATARRLRLARRCALAVLLVSAAFFVVECARRWDVFSGDAPFLPDDLRQSSHNGANPRFDSHANADASPARIAARSDSAMSSNPVR